MTSSARATAPDGTAQTWQRSWARIRSGSMARTCAVVERVDGLPRRHLGTHRGIDLAAR